VALPETLFHKGINQDDSHDELGNLGKAVTKKVCTVSGNIHHENYGGK